MQPLANACEEFGLTPPRIVTECGRAMTAHHAVLIANVSEVEEAQEGRVPDQHDDEPAAIRHLREIHDELDVRPAVELFRKRSISMPKAWPATRWARSTCRSVRASTICSTPSPTACVRA